eukprot:scaffold17881_cov14-Tisochrysis_lutea.AAC.1
MALELAAAERRAMSKRSRSNKNTRPGPVGRQQKGSMMVPRKGRCGSKACGQEAERKHDGA